MTTKTESAKGEAAAVREGMTLPLDNLVEAQRMPNSCEFEISKQEAAAVGDDALTIANKALLLAARWFKLNLDDPTLPEYPITKPDLAGMFDAMQKAREQITARQASPAQGGVGDDVVQLLKRISNLKETIYRDGAAYAGRDIRPVIKDAETMLAAMHTTPATRVVQGTVEGAGPVPRKATTDAP